MDILSDLKNKKHKQMKRTAILWIILLTLFASCKQKINYSEDIQGKWLCQEIKGKDEKPLIIPTNDAFVLQFNSGGNLDFSKGYTLPNANGNSWIENHDFTYTITDNELLIKGKNTLGEEINMLLTVEQLTSMDLICKESSYQINREEKGLDRTFYLTRIYKNYTQNIIGTWEVRKVDKLDPDTFVFAKYVFAENNTLDIYELSNGAWQPSDMNIHYFLNGELLSINYALNSDLPYNRKYCCWLIQDFSTNRILIRNWQAIQGSHNLQGTTYELKKIN
jgi:hypothetical protein